MLKECLLAATACAAVLATPVLAADNDACLQNNRIWSWDVLDQRTMVVSDRDHHRFLVHLGGGCVGLDNAKLTVAFRSWSNLGCLRAGDKVSYRDIGAGEQSCVVNSVEPYKGAERDDFDKYNRDSDSDRKP